MARHKNDGRGRIGGRAKGTPNKQPLPFPAWLDSLIDKQRNTFEKDLAACPAPERAAIVAQLIAANVQRTQTPPPVQ